MLNKHFYAFFGYKLFEKNYLLTSLKKIKVMRKMYKIASIACLGLMLSSTNINAQTADFENLTLPAESYWDGSDLSGTHNNGLFSSEFTSGDFIFPNVYDTTYGTPYYYWSGGFAYSNKTDSVTSGDGNKYSSRAGGGANSLNYVVAANNSNFKIANNYQILKFKITNSTYAYNSMRDGDMFAKKFGGATGDDPDWFKLNIKIYLLGNLEDSVDFYLADFRFSDNSQDYILKDWTSVLLNPVMTTFDSVYFELSSSDVGMWGMNTPAFFCLDYIELEMVTSVNDITQNTFSFFPNPVNNVLNIKSENTIEQISITDMSGRTIKTINSNNTKQTSIDVADLTSGIYFVQVVSNGVSKVQKFIKQ